MQMSLVQVGVELDGLRQDDKVREVQSKQVTAWDEGRDVVVSAPLRCDTVALVRIAEARRAAITKISARMTSKLFS